MTMRLLIADDHELLRDTLRSFLQQQDDLEICTVGDLSQAVAQLDDGCRYDLILLDYTMPGMNGLDGLQLLLERPDTPPVALISGIAKFEVALQAIQMGAQGFLQKSMPAQLRLDEGAGTRPDVNLTSRETEVLAALCCGLTNKEIARSMNLSEPTIKLHVKTLYRRLGATNRTQAAMIGRNMGLS